MSNSVYGEKEIPCIGWQETFDAALDIFALISKDFEFLKLNHMGYKSLGLKPKDVIGKKCYNIVHGLDAPIKNCPCIKALKTKIASSGEIFDKGKYYITTASPILDGDNNILAFTHTVKDITEYKKLEGSLKKVNDTLEARVKERTAELLKTNRDLTHEVEEHSKVVKALKKSESILLKQRTALEQKNIALAEIVAQIEIEKSKIKEEINSNVERIILPLLERLNVENGPTEYVDLIQHHLKNLTSSYGSKITKNYYKLTPREIELCNLIKAGLPCKDISKLLNISIKTVNKHRRNIRSKLKITNKEINLTTLLREL